MERFFGKFAINNKANMIRFFSKDFFYAEKHKNIVDMIDNILIENYNY